MSQAPWIRKSLLIPVALAALLTSAPAECRTGEEEPPLVRIRSHSPVISKAIAEGPSRSENFRRLVAEVGETDGLIYVEEGRCGHSVRACLLLSVTMAGPLRLLHVRVNTRKVSSCELIGLIGHELQHVVEVLREPQIRTFEQIYRLFERHGPTGHGAFETNEAIRVGFVISREACRRPGR
jgi:hypothetical protein